MINQSLLNHTIVDTPIGQILVVGSGKGLRKVSIHTSQKSVSESIAQQCPQSIELPDGFGGLPQRLKRYVHGEKIIFNDKLDLGNATPFRRAVWEATRSIPYGETRSYEWIAQRIGKPKAARAVGQALKSNPFPIIVPCHRVIGKDGSLTGFSCGIDVKKRLLDMEASPHATNRAH